MQQHDVVDTTTRTLIRAKACPQNTPDAPESEDDIQQQTPTPENNSEGFLEQMRSSNEVTQRWSQRQVSPTWKHQILRQICWRPILMENSLGIQSIYHPLAICLPVSLPLPSGHGRWSGSCWISILMVALTYWECFLFFWRRQLWFWPLVLLWYFGGSFVWVAFLFAGEWLLLPQFQRVHLHPQHQIIDQFP